jgi:hypothetical protein
VTTPLKLFRYRIETKDVLRQTEEPFALTDINAISDNQSVKINDSYRNFKNDEDLRIESI